MSDRFRTGITVIVVVIGLAFTAGLVRYKVACEAKHGTLVRSAFWFACVQEVR